jgi:hypothetical protein
MGIFGMDGVGLNEGASCLQAGMRNTGSQKLRGTAHATDATIAYSGVSDGRWYASGKVTSERILNGWQLGFKGL